MDRLGSKYQLQHLYLNIILGSYKLWFEQKELAICQLVSIRGVFVTSARMCASFVCRFSGASGQAGDHHAPAQPAGPARPPPAAGSKWKCAAEAVPAATVNHASVGGTGPQRHGHRPQMKPAIPSEKDDDPPEAACLGATTIYSKNKISGPSFSRAGFLSIFLSDHTSKGVIKLRSQ